jgi:hypothetical protein
MQLRKNDSFNKEVVPEQSEASSREMVPNVGFELTTYCLQDSCSTTELIRRMGAGNYFYLKKLQEIFQFKKLKSQQKTWLKNSQARFFKASKE